MFEVSAWIVKGLVAVVVAAAALFEPIRELPLFGKLLLAALIFGLAWTAVWLEVKGRRGTRPG